MRNPFKKNDRKVYATFDPFHQGTMVSPVYYQPVRKKKE
jgi:hypothetical protein